MKRIIAIWSIIVLSILETQGQTISGWVKDAETNESLPFATVAIKGTSQGTITNEDGHFEFNISEKSNSLFVSFMGYNSAEIQLDKSTSKPLVINLKPSILTLEELVIRPLSPEDYIKRVVKNQVNALPQEPYSAKAYYREKFKENDGYIAFNEGIFKFHFPTYQDSLANQYQLCLFETAKNPQELQFMKRKVDKKEERRKRRAEKKGGEYDGEDENENLIHVNFGGPKRILETQMGEELEPFMDSTRFKKFKYEFGTPQQYQGRNLMVINFKSRGKEEHQRTSGKIYIDTRLDAFAGVEYDGELVIPILIEPVLLAFGITISNPTIKKVTRMQFLDGYWYPDYQRMDVQVRMKKIYLFAKNEISNMDIDQVLKVSDIELGSTAEIPKEKRFKTDKNPEEQIFNDENWEWEDFNRITE